jgi:hypothetical protein
MKRHTNVKCFTSHAHLRFEAEIVITFAAKLGAG